MCTFFETVNNFRNTRIFVLFLFTFIVDLLNFLVTYYFQLTRIFDPLFFWLIDILGSLEFLVQCYFLSTSFLLIDIFALYFPFYFLNSRYNLWLQNSCIYMCCLADLARPQTYTDTSLSNRLKLANIRASPSPNQTFLIKLSIPRTQLVLD